MYILKALKSSIIVHVINIFVKINHKAISIFRHTKKAALLRERVVSVIITHFRIFFFSEVWHKQINTPKITSLREGSGIPMRIITVNA